MWFHATFRFPVVFHNLSGYNTHLFIRELRKESDSRSIGVIAENKENYTSFNVDVIVGRYKDMWGRIEGELQRQSKLNSVQNPAK